MPLIQPKDVVIKTRDGEKTYILSKFPAIQGREIICGYPLTAMPKIGDYRENKETMLKLMAFVAVRMENGVEMPLNTAALVDAQVPDWEALMRLEWAMLEYNTSFFTDGRASAFLAGVQSKWPKLLSRILMDLSGQLSQKAEQPSTSSAPSTP